MKIINAFDIVKIGFGNIGDRRNVLNAVGCLGCNGKNFFIDDA